MSKNGKPTKPLTEEQKRARAQVERGKQARIRMQNLRDAGKTNAEIADSFGLSESTVREILRPKPKS